MSGEFTRRRVLVAAGVTTLVGVTGCTDGGESTTTDGGESTTTDGDESTTTDGDESTTTDGDDDVAGESTDANAWPTYQHDDRNTGFNPDVSGPASEPTVDWVGSVGHTDGPATVVDGVVYVGGPELVYAYDPDGGDEEWTYEVGEMTDAAITVDDGTAVFPSRDGNVHAVSASDGTERWVRTEINGNSVVEAGDLGIKQGSATVADGTVYVSAQNGREEAFYGLDVETGDPGLVVDGWPTDDGEEAFTNTPAIVEGTAYLASRSGNVYSVDLDSGSVGWVSTPSDTRGEEIGSVFGSPAVVDGSVYFTNHAQGPGNEPVLYELDAASGDTSWSYSLGPRENNSRSLGSVLVAHDAVFASNRNGVLHAVERADGTERWTFDTGARIYGAASADAERVYVGNDDGNVFALDPSTGDVQWQVGSGIDQIEHVDAAPTPVEGSLYVTSDDGSLVALTG